MILFGRSGMKTKGKTLCTIYRYWTNDDRPANAPGAWQDFPDRARGSPSPGF